MESASEMHALLMRLVDDVNSLNTVTTATFVIRFTTKNERVWGAGHLMYADWTGVHSDQSDEWLGDRRCA